MPLAAQIKVHPVRPSREEVSVLVTSDRTAFSVDKSFQNKLTLGYPSENKVAFIPETGASLIMLWLRVHNTSQRPLRIDISKFTSRDDEGKTYSVLTPDVAYTRIVSAAGSLGTKALRGISLGRVGGRPDEEELKEDIQRYSLQQGELPPGGVREGLIYFEAPTKKKFNVSIVLGDLWSRPLVFSTEKQR